MEKSFFRLETGNIPFNADYNCIVYPQEISLEDGVPSDSQGQMKDKIERWRYGDIEMGGDMEDLWQVYGEMGEDMEDPWQVWTHTRVGPTHTATQCHNRTMACGYR